MLLQSGAIVLASLGSFLVLQNNAIVFIRWGSSLCYKVRSLLNLSCIFISSTSPAQVRKGMFVCRPTI